MSEAGTAPIALVIEDDEQIVQLLQFILRKEGYAVTTALDGNAARELIAEIPPPAIVTLDSMLPYASGLELLALIRARQDWNKVPVLMLSAKSQETDTQQALAAGAAAYVVKPFKPEELRACVRLLVGGL